MRGLTSSISRTNSEAVAEMKRPEFGMLRLYVRSTKRNRRTHVTPQLAFACGQVWVVGFSWQNFPFWRKCRTTNKMYQFDARVVSPTGTECAQRQVRRR